VTSAGSRRSARSIPSPSCLRHYGVEERVKTLIARKCGGDKAPDSLRERLRIEISRTTIIRRG
jgi:mycothiol system anti-sigma-R factor